MGKVVRTRRARFAHCFAAIATLMVGLLALPSVAEARPAPPPTDGPATPTPDQNEVDLSGVDADRWIVQLDDPSVAATNAGSETRLDVNAADKAAYRDQLEAKQEAVAAQIGQVAPGASTERSYQVALNGMAVKMSGAQAEAVRDLPGVASVSPDLPYQMEMFATPEQIGAPAVWAQLGGQDQAGDGVKVAIIDSGVFVKYDEGGNYVGNPCFSDEGYTAPAGYPKGDTQFTNNKVIAARAYFRPDDPPIAGEETPVQGTVAASPHGTHVGGTVACNAGTVATVSDTEVTLSGVAPRAFLMNYRVFYPSQSPEDFQNGNAYVAELVQAIDDAVADGADVISNSWGSSYQNTFAWPDPMVQASEAAVDAGVTMVYAQGNSGPGEATGNSPANSPKVIAVGAVTKNVTIVPGAVDVTAPTPVPPDLTGMAVGPAQFGPQVTTTLGPAPFIAAQTASGGSTLGCAAFPAGSLTGAIAVIERGTCEFSTKVFNAQEAGAVATLVYNSAANGDNLQSMGPGVTAPLVTTPSWFMRRSQGLALAAHAIANPGTSAGTFTYAPQTTSNIGDVMAGFSSRGPTQDKTLKPDVVAPGVDVVSGGYAVGDYPTPFAGFGSASGTSMATPHVAGAAALLIALHPEWSPAQVKSALMSTANQNVFIDTAQAVQAGVLTQGAGRIDLEAAADPGLTFNHPSLSGGEVAAGWTKTYTISVRGTTNGSPRWNLSATADDGLTVTPLSTSIRASRGAPASLKVNVTIAADAAPGDYTGEVVLTRASDGKALHIPVWLGVRPAPTTDVLLVDDDGSNAGFTDYAATYTSTLDALGVSYDVVDPWNEGFPAYLDLYAYQSIVVFTGDNDSFDTSGFFLSDHDNISQWMDSGGKLWVTGQNAADVLDSNASFASESIGRGRLYHGYLGVRFQDGSAYPGAAPAPSATGSGAMAGVSLDLSPNGDGIDNQTSVEAADPMPNNDTFQGADTVTPLFTPIGGDAPAGSAISWSRGSEPSLAEERVMFRYRSVYMGFGLEGVNGAANQQAIADRTLDWLLDTHTVSVNVALGGFNKKKATLTAAATSSVGATIVGYRWDFGDGSGFTNTSGPTVRHDYTAAGTYNARVQVTDSLGHVSVTKFQVKVR